MQQPRGPVIPPVRHGERPRWSVMVPTFNCDEYLVATLESVLRELGPDAQVEVVDDRSTQGDPEAVARRVGGGRVGFFRQPRNVGHTRNFNTCLRRATGHLVHVLHGDDLVEGGFYVRMGALLDAHPDAGAAICRHAVVDEAGVHRALGTLLQLETGPLDGWLPRIASGQLVQPPGVVVRRSVYEAVGGFDESIRRYGEDWEMWVRVAAATPVVYEPAALAAYRVRRSGSLSDQTHVRRNMADMRRVLRANHSTLVAAGVSDARTIERTARTELSGALLRRAARLAAQGRVPFDPVIEAVRFHPRPVTSARAALAIGRAIGQRIGVDPLETATARRLRESADRRRGRAVSPLAPLADAPPEIAASIGHAEVRGLPASPAPKDHLMYAVGDDRMLHRYGPPATRIRRSLGDRRTIDQLGITGIPRLHVAASTDHHVWILEDRLPGHPPATEATDDWFRRATGLLVEVAGPPGPPLCEVAFWASHAEEAATTASPELRGSVVQAWATVARLPTRILHGDAQPQNLLLSSAGIGLVDWEGAWRHGLPGLDLVFLALTSTPGSLDGDAAASLALGRDVAGRPVLDALAAVGIEGALLRPSLLAILSTLSLGERLRSERSLQRRGMATPFRALLDEFGPRLAGAVA